MYTLRNGRKQYIVEVSEDNVDKVGSGKVQIPPDLALTLHVEYVSLYYYCISCDLKLKRSFSKPRPVRQPTSLQSHPPASQFLTPVSLHGATASQLASPAASEAASPAMAPAETSTRKRSRPQPDAIATSDEQTHGLSTHKKQRADAFHPG